MTTHATANTDGVTSDSPQLLSPDFDILQTCLADLVARDQWVVWRRDHDKDGRLTKVPYDPQRPGHHASTSKPGTWGSFLEAKLAYKDGGLDGIGFVLTKDDPFVGIDLDNCIDLEEGVPEEGAAEIVGEIDSYTERSPSGRGFRIIATGTLPPGGKKAGNIEMYEAGRYLTLTGHHVDGTPKEVEERTDELAELHARVFPNAILLESDPQAVWSTSLTDDEVVRKARKKPRVDHLWEGNWEILGDYPSQSEADLALCGDLAFYAGPDPDRIDRLFRQSKLFRPKWDKKHHADGRTYGQATIERALAGRTTFYGQWRTETRASSVLDGDSPVDPVAVLTTLREQAAIRPGMVVRETLEAPQTLGALALAAGQDRSAFEAALLALREAGVKVREVEALKRAVKETRIQRSTLRLVDPDEAELPNVTDSLPDAPVSGAAVVPTGWRLTPHGVAREIAARNKVNVTPVAPAPIVITGRLTEIADGTESVRVAWFRDGGWREQTVDRATVANTREVVGLAGVGFPVTSKTAGDVVTFLADYEAANLEHLPRARISGQMGWQGEAGRLGFLCGRTLIRPGGQAEGIIDIEAMAPADWRADWVAFRGSDAGDGQLADGFTSGGTFDGWREAAQIAARYPRVVLALYTALVPPLLAILDARNFAVDWSFSTSTGKTTTLRLAASCWGNPDERAPAAALGTWDGTRVWFERASTVLNGLPLILDDTKRAKYPKTVAQVLYDVTSGRGRGRGSPIGMRRSGSWATVLLSTGEAPATTFTEDGGTRARVLTLWGSPFGKADGETAVQVEALNLGLREHHGYAGPRLVAYLLAHRDHWSDWREQYRGARAGLVERANGNPVAGRLADYLAAIDMAALLAHEALALPWDCLNVVDLLWDDLVKEAGEADRAERALAMAASWARGNAHMFWERHQVDHNENVRVPPQGWAGRWDDAQGWEHIAFLPHRLKAILEDLGFEPEPVLRTWRDRGWLELTGNGTRPTKQVRIDGSQTWCYVVRRAAVEEAEGA